MILGTFLTLAGAVGLAALCAWALWTMHRQDRALCERDELITALNGALGEADQLTTAQAAQIEKARIAGGLVALHFAAEHDPRERLAANVGE